MFRAKNYLNRPMFHGVIQKITPAVFFETRCIRRVSEKRHPFYFCDILSHFIWYC